MDNDQFKPVSFDPHAHAAKRRKTDPAFRAAYDALEDEFAALDAMLRARKEAGLTQAGSPRQDGGCPACACAHRSSLASRKHSPSLATLRRYADACGKKLVIQMIDEDEETEPVCRDFRRF